ncbi:NUDIX family hydrolase, putative [Talaromyces stipitatus ATCC 10500]|uniref:NUDIX family hydrolase, putative n=1 Tax=Talaromyces stipitatus (strain ATCC 10500 / CBS 375.48 / QM 6759 / NRRL 1006) TaxID=441959 RepID=B8M9U7_TALSN|nr:NUDIX family hydrolase, putative [Talaromyces stipitatus ATCC 10500]EED18099.1 NUDIX family hydrolase, putative [Talaromyces stipitatus ATCC 10500]
MKPILRLQSLSRSIYSPPRRGISTMTTTFTIPFDNPFNNTTSIPVILAETTSISKGQLLSFPAFKTWLSSLHKSLAEQSSSTHEFHKSPYMLRKIDIQAVDYFGGGRLGFSKMKVDVSNDIGESLPGSILLRGGSVAMLLILQADDVPSTSEKDKYVIMTIQPRIPAGTLKFAEIPAGMLDDSGTFAGGAAKEIHEETGLSIPQDELIDMTALASATESEGNLLQKAVYPSPGGSDEFIPVFLCQKRMSRKDIEGMQGRLTGNRNEKEKITLKIVPLEELWREGFRDAKTLAAWALYEGLRREGKDLSCR